MSPHETTAAGKHPPTHPGRSSRVWNVETPSGSGHGDVSGKPTVRKWTVPGLVDTGSGSLWQQGSFTDGIDTA